MCLVCINTATIKHELVCNTGLLLSANKPMIPFAPWLHYINHSCGLIHSSRVQFTGQVSHVDDDYHTDLKPSKLLNLLYCVIVKCENIEFKVRLMNIYVWQ